MDNLLSSVHSHFKFVVVHVFFKKSIVFQSVFVFRNGPDDIFSPNSLECPEMFNICEEKFKLNEFKEEHVLHFGGWGLGAGKI